MLRASPLLLWLSMTLAGWASQSGSTEVDLGAGMADYTFVPFCGGRRRVVTSPVYAQVRRVQPSQVVWAGELAVSPGKVQARGSDPEVSTAECTSQCEGDAVFAGQLALRVGYQVRKLSGEIGPAVMVDPSWGWIPLPSAVVRFGDPSVLYGHVSFLAGPFTGDQNIDLVQVGLGRRRGLGEVLLTTNPLVVTGDMAPSLRLMVLAQLDPGVGLGVDLGASSRWDSDANPGLRGLVVLRIDPRAL